jgi:hypothetical protein
MYAFLPASGINTTLHQIISNPAPYHKESLKSIIPVTLFIESCHFNFITRKSYVGITIWSLTIDFQSTGMMAYFKSSLVFQFIFLDTVFFTQIQIDAFNRFNLFRLYWSFFYFPPSILATEVKPPALFTIVNFRFLAGQNIFSA